MNVLKDISKKARGELIDFYEVGSFNDNIKEILDKHNSIFNTSGEHKIEEIFEGYEKQELKINA